LAFAEGPGIAFISIREIEAKNVDFKVIQ